MAVPASAYDGPIIDMHLHAWPLGADGTPDEPRNQTAMTETLARLDAANVVLAMASGPQAFLDAWAEARCCKPRTTGARPGFPLASTD